MQFNLKQIGHEELLHRFAGVMQEEKRITQKVVEFIAEVDRRRLYLQTHASLFEFLTLGYGYSAAGAQRRIDAARLLNEIPELSAQMESGSLNITQISKVQQALRQARKLGQEISTQKKREILQGVANVNEATAQSFSRQSFEKKTEVFLAQALSLPPECHAKEKIHADESVTLTLTFTKEEMEDLRKAQALLSHALPGPKWQDLFLHMAKKVMKSKAPAAASKGSKASEDASKKDSNFAADLNLAAESRLPQESSLAESVSQSAPAEKPRAATPASSVRKTISLPLRKLKMAECLGCEYPLPDGGTCGSQNFLQLDHIQPVWAGGDSEPDNLRVLCAAHNRERYRQQAGLAAK